MGKEKVATQHRHIGTEDPMHGLLLSSLIRIIQNVILGQVPQKITIEIVDLPRKFMKILIFLP